MKTLVKSLCFSITLSLTCITTQCASSNSTKLDLMNQAIIVRDKALRDLHNNKDSSKRLELLTKYYDAQHKYLLQKKHKKESK